MRVTLTGMTTTTALPFMSYPVAASRFRVSVRTLSRLVAEGSVTAHPSQRDKRRVLLDPHEIADALGVDLPPVNSPTEEKASTTETVTVAEATTILSLSATLNKPELYHLLRSQLTEEFTGYVALVLGGEDRLVELDTLAGYSPAEES